MKFTKTIFLLFILTSLLNSKTYEIIEQDMYEEVLSRKDIAINAIKKDKEKQIKKWKNYKGSLLASAQESKITDIDPTYTLTQDIPKVNKIGMKIGVLYKKGYSFNPLEYITITPPDMIVFNACIPEESNKVKKIIQTRYEKKQLMLVNSGCKSADYFDKYFIGKTYFLTDEMVRKFKLKETISIISTDLNEKRIKIETIKTLN